MAAPRPTTTAAAAPTTTISVASTTASGSVAAARYVFPVVGRSSYSHTHAGYPATDIFAKCGSQVVAVTGGRVDEVSRVDRWDPAQDDPALRGGLSVSLVGDDGVRYYTSHFVEVAPDIEAGQRVAAGTTIGRVGQTGNARGKPCHTHFGLSPPTEPGDWEVRRGVVWPGPYLDAWKAGGQKSPAEEVSQWQADQ